MIYTDSRFTEAASLCKDLVYSFSGLWDVGDDEPSVMIIAINVQHLLALDAEDTVMRLEADIVYGEENICTQKAHIQSILFSNSISISVSSIAG